MPSIKEKSVKGSLWSLIDNACSQGFAFLIGIVLARLLSPTDYGTVGVLAIFLAIANVFVDCGFGNALIRKKDRTQEDLSTAFYFNIVVGIAVYLILFAIAPIVAWFFNMPILVSLLRVLGFCVVFNSLSIVQNSLLTAQIKIKKQAIINVCTQIPMGVVGIALAYKGFGVWTLVVQQVGSSLLKTLWLWVSSKWKPTLLFSLDSFHYLYNFGWKLLGTNLLGTFFNEIYGFFIGRFLGSRDLGLYSNSKQLSEYPRSLVNNIVNRVVLPVMVETQGDKNSVKITYSRLIQLLCYITFPLYGVLIINAEPIILELWTDKWKDSVVLFQIFCIGVAFGPISTLNFCLLQLLNRTDVMLKLEFVKKPICFALLLVSIPLGLKGIVLFATFYNIIGTIINMYPTYKYLRYSYKEQAWDIFKNFLLTMVTLILIYIPISYIDNNWVYMFLSTVLFCLTYLILSILFKNQVLAYIKNLLLHK